MVIVAVQMDPIELINIKTDTTFLLALAAQKRGHRLYYYQPKSLTFENDTIYASAYPLTVENTEGAHFKLGKQEQLDLMKTDVILVRQDPPYDMAYLTSCHLLEHIEKQTAIINSPKAIRNSPEKLAILQFPELIPPPLISADKERIFAFLELHRDIILKPIYVCGGRDVFRVKTGDSNTTALIDILLTKYQLPLIAQTYIPEVVKGDKRVVLIDGEPVGAILRVPKEGETRANLHVGGKAVKTELTPRDTYICRRISDYLREQGIFLAGIDIIGDYLTEINITSPTGFHEINHFNNSSLQEIFWERLEPQIPAI